MGDNAKEGASRSSQIGLSTQVDSIAMKLQESELVDKSNPTTTKLLRNLTEIQLVKKISRDPSTQSDSIEHGSSEALCIIPDTEQNTPEDLINADKFVISDSKEDTVHACVQCCLPRKSKFKVTNENNLLYICDDVCLNLYKKIMGNKIGHPESSAPSTPAVVVPVSSQKYLGKFILGRKCAECEKSVLGEEQNLSWEMMEFCNEACLTLYQKAIGSHCTYCQNTVQNASLGKYCVRFGYNVRQFCSNICLEEFKKGLKLCSYCQKDMSGEDGFLAPIGDKAQFKEFCTKICMEKYEAMSSNRIYPVDGAFQRCGVCRVDKEVLIEYVEGSKVNSFCGEPCFVAFKFVNNVTPEKCIMCHKYFDTQVFDDNSAYIDDVYQKFCSKSCLNVYIITHRKIVCCSWCKVKKYDFDMILRSGPDGQTLKMCSLNCLSMHQLSLKEVHAKSRAYCHFCLKKSRPQYYLKMADASSDSFCSYPCVMAFQKKFALTMASSVPAITQKEVAAKTEKKDTTAAMGEEPVMPIITNVQSLAAVNGPTTSGTKPRTKNKTDKDFIIPPPPPPPPPPPVIETRVKHQFIIKSPLPPPQRNIATMCKVITATQEATCIPEKESIEIQTDDVPEKIKIIPVPVPLYIPTPIWMYSNPYPVPFPFSLPLPVPVFIPTTKNLAKGIMKEIEKTQIDTPSDPLEAELLTMAEMVAADKKDDHSGSESDVEINIGLANETTLTSEPVSTNALFGEDAIDTHAPITDWGVTDAVNIVSAPIEEEQLPLDESLTTDEVEDPNKGRKRGPRPPRKTGKRGRRVSSQKNLSTLTTSSLSSTSVLPPSDSSEKPDANMCLKFTFGVNAWKQWVALKNAEIERSSLRTKLFKPEILQLTADELNYSLCLFVKEVRKPNGQEYAPDTIYYLCLGIQQYLLENARIDNIFCDAYYERFTDCLDEIARKFSVLYNDAHYIVTRVEEEHLWESKQLGAHSPHVLLSTLMFFNTKHFNLSTVEEHMQLSFSHIMKHWKRNPNQSGAKAPGSRNVLLRFYPPHSSTDLGGRKKKVYEQQENEENPLRCPVKLYEFYLSKCPESVKTRNDVFYLLPERSCVPDSPVWYSTTALPQKALEKMLHRVKMAKEVNVALLTS